jgi:hypothetical protein
MNDYSWYGERDQRLLQYAHRRLDPTRWITIRAEPDYGASYAGQVAILTAANLLGRMSPSVALDIPRTSIVAPLPWHGRNLAEFALDRLRESDPHARFRVRTVQERDYVVHLGHSGPGLLAHGVGWFAYVGNGPSPLPTVPDLNPLGPALAAIIAAARLFVHDFAPPSDPLVLNALDWTHSFDGQAPSLPVAPKLGEIWTVGCGSVGTATLYFLTLATTNFATALFDMDKVKRLNITRSPIFKEADVGENKVEVTANYLRRCGVNSVATEPRALDECARWTERRAGTPDLLIAAANERNVRPYIESMYPPIQIYGTTGRNWQAAVLRHIPVRDACSCCVFPEGEHPPTACATDTMPTGSSDDQADASLPFLSFAAGLMAAAEILKLSMPNYPFSEHRAYLFTDPQPRLMTVRGRRRPGCLCASRSPETHSKVIEGSRFASLTAERP